MTRLQVVAGCPALVIFKGDILKVTRQPFHTGGGVYSFGVEWMRNGQHSRTLYCRLWENHDEFNANSGNPTKKVRLRKLPDPAPAPPPECDVWAEIAKEVRKPTTTPASLMAFLRTAVEAHPRQVAEGLCNHILGNKPLFAYRG